MPRIRPGWTAAIVAVLLGLGPERALAAEGGLFDINTGLSVWLLIVFALLVFLLGKYAWGPILKAVDAREERIRDAIDGAKETRAEARSLLAEQREHLAEARRRAGDIIQEGRAAGEALQAEIEEKARAEARALVERAKAEIARERDAALQELRRESVEVALAAASRLVSERLDEERDRRVVERYLSEIGSSR